MPQEERDAIQFAASMKVQSYDLMPEEFSEEEKDYIANILYEHTKLAYEALEHDEEYEFTYEYKTFSSQVVAEWTFHKAVDLIKSGVPKEYWDNILQKLAFTAFEVAKTGIIKDKEQQETLNAVEHHINKVWKECIEELYLKGKIDLDIKAKALKQSNIDELAKQAKEKEANKESDTENQQIETIKNNRGCMSAVQFLVFVSAALVTLALTFIFKVLNIETAILKEIKYICFCLGALTCFIYSICILVQHFKNNINPNIFGAISGISKNILFYTSCGLFGVMSVLGFKPLICILGSVTFIKLSAIATVNQIKYKNTQ